MSHELQRSVRPPKFYCGCEGHIFVGRRPEVEAMRHDDGNTVHAIGGCIGKDGRLTASEIRSRGLEREKENRGSCFCGKRLVRWPRLNEEVPTFDDFDGVTHSAYGCGPGAPLRQNGYPTDVYGKSPAAEALGCVPKFCNIETTVLSPTPTERFLCKCGKHAFEVGEGLRASDYRYDDAATLHSTVLCVGYKDGAVGLVRADAAIRARVEEERNSPLVVVDELRDSEDEAEKRPACAACEGESNVGHNHPMTLIDYVKKLGEIPLVPKPELRWWLPSAKPFERGNYEPSQGKRRDATPEIAEALRTAKPAELTIWFRELLDPDTSPQVLAEKFAEGVARMRAEHRKKYPYANDRPMLKPAVAVELRLTWELEPFTCAKDKD